MTTTTANTDTRNRAAGGVLLIAVGLLLLAGQIIRVDHLFLPILGGVFILAAVTQRNPGLLVPGGILMGIGVGSFLTDNVFFAMAEPVRSGLFLVSLAGGFVLITVLSTLFTRHTQVWALFPATIIGLIGGALLIGGSAINVLAFLGQVWPVFLILGGLMMLVQRR
jgi:hypothetical protein